ncbi:chemotaxis protein CheA [Leptospira levettii]|uniref:chemotaxis protein CheA n=1 Tax=Leptospira levettii TaxID=2023178 RepID=UPI0010846BF8|nr:chemotaxis protein CheA [Leptospira levettii]MCW7507749.1 chemotaxis protein CheA [Leptospira levettii]MCW7518839.1 chemotaxis protein CheA [Leptospira levettii]TGK98807.1 chemotaxis protein CheA [Leptospira levettii]
MNREDLLLGFIQEGFELIEDCENAILAIEEIQNSQGNFDEELMNNLFRSVHTFKGSSGLLKLETLVKLTHEAETLMDLLRNQKLLPSNELTQVLIDTFDRMRVLLSKVETLKANPEMDPPTELQIQALKGEIHKLQQHSVVETVSEKPKKEKKIYEIFDEEEPPKETNKKSNVYEIFDEETNQTVAKNKKFEIFEEEPKQTQTEVTLNNSKVERLGDQNKPVISNIRKEIKVANDKLDSLLDLVGELVIAESNVTQHPTIKSIRNESLNSALTRFHKILLDLQEVAFSTRMIPISGVFQKMSRLVRDLQKQSGKKVLLHIKGEDTEIDKSIVDLIADPIVHILRNSIDHGLEAPEERMNRGKSDTGNIYLSARQSVNEVWVMIKDDGRGLDRNKILEKAKQNGLISGDTSALSDQEVFNLIFLPGLSTAKVVSDISGRGVGMDIVRQNIVKLGGKIEIHSQFGVGTTFVLRIPLSLGIMEGTVVRVGQKFFTIQTIELREFVSLRDKKEIELDEGQKVLDIRGTFIPIFNINQILNHKEQIIYDNEDPLMIILEYERKLIGIRVDEIIGNQNVVIKPLMGIMENAQGVNGFTILGNGNVSLILDVKSIFSKLEFVGVS